MVAAKQFVGALVTRRQMSPSPTWRLRLALPQLGVLMTIRPGYNAIGLAKLNRCRRFITNDMRAVITGGIGSEPPAPITKYDAVTHILSSVPDRHVRGR